MNFEDKIAVVTGGSRGIGKQIAMDLIGSGAIVYIVSRNKPDWELPNRMKHICSDFNGDITDLLLFLKQNKIDILVNNAGINIIKPLKDVTEEDYDKIHNINLKVPYMLSKAGNFYDDGKIVNIASIWSIKTKAWRSLYSTTKNGIIGLTKSTSVELAPNVLVNAVSPGFTNTDLTDKSLIHSEKYDLSSQIPMKRFAETKEISNLVLFLCSDSNTYITGQNIVIDGGFTNI
jgi:3-oxoacyl-[acyl-carrier protein] reductase